MNQIRTGIWQTSARISGNHSKPIMRNQGSETTVNVAGIKSVIPGSTAYAATKLALSLISLTGCKKLENFELLIDANI